MTINKDARVYISHKANDSRNDDVYGYRMGVLWRGYL